MGEVYRARDIALGRDVAIKIAHPAGGDDPAGRFQREAQVLASLNHPNIAHIYTLLNAPGPDAALAIVMEVVEGPTLEQLIHKRLPVDGALKIARQIAEALDAAHEKGVVHRDLKPSNVKVKTDGTVKVLDFGLAKVLESPVAMPLDDSETTVAATEPGLIVGTAPYMSPEQARGATVDKRTDIWAFGCVLFEMITGAQAFRGRTMADTVAGILTREPDWSALPASTPAAVRRVLKRCLEKDPRQRLRDIGDARAELAEVGTNADSDAARSSPASASTRGSWKFLAAAIVGAAIALVIVAFVSRPAVHPESVTATRLSLGVPGELFTQPPSAVISPDGRMIAFVATDNAGKDLLWIRPLDTQDARPLAGTERADMLFWSPDSRFLGFFADGELKTIAIADGHVQTLTRAPVSPGAAWNAAGTILFAQSGVGFKTISVGGGDATLVGTAQATAGRSWPHFLPDGKHFIFFEATPGRKSGVFVGSLDGGEATRLIDTDFEAIYAPPGYLLFVRDDTLLAQPFDASTLTMSGTARAVASSVWVARGYGHGAFSVADNGTIAYVNAAIANTQLAWFDASGRPLGTIGPPGQYDSPPQISPDGASVAVARGGYGQRDIWILGAARDTSTRFTFDQAANRVPLWLHDGNHLLFESQRGGTLSRVYERNADGSGADERVGGAAEALRLQDASPDGRVIVYTIAGKNGRSELWTMAAAGGTPTPYLQADANFGQAQLSPDGKWIAYVSNESGREEVFVQSFPQPGNKHQVSDGGGAQPRWKKNGGALFYLAPDRTLMSVPLQTAATIQIGRPAPLFRTRLEFLALQGPIFMAGYDVSADGQRFLLNAPATLALPPIDVVLNWTSLLR